MKEAAVWTGTKKSKMDILLRIVIEAIASSLNQERTHRTKRRSHKLLLRKSSIIFRGYSLTAVIRIQVWMTMKQTRRYSVL